MSKILQQLGEIIGSSSISIIDQNDLLIFLPILPESALEELLGIFEKDIKSIKDFNENFKARLNVLVGGQNKWDDLIAQEERMLENEDKGYNEEEEEESF